MGLATGCVGMSLTDFERCTPSEFRAVWKAWQERETQRERRSWEQTRAVCVTLLQPYSKRALRGGDVLHFPWDDETESHLQQEAAEPLTHEEEMERYREARKRAGLK